MTVAVAAQTTHSVRRQRQVIQDHLIRMYDSEQDLDHECGEDSSVMECVGGEGIFTKRENGSRLDGEKETQRWRERDRDGTDEEKDEDGREIPPVD